MSSPAEGQRFQAQVADWPKRWQAVEPPVDCKGLLPGPEQPACGDARAALEGLKAALPGGNRSTILRKAGELALAAQRAAEKLRKAGLAELMPEPGSHPSLVAPPKPSAVRPPSPPPSASAHAHDSHDHAPPENVHKNPTLTAILEYSRLASLALRHLATYLEHGPPDARREALTELVRLGKEQPRWKALESLAREARLTESDAELRAKLDNLITMLRAERGQ